MFDKYHSGFNSMPSVDSRIDFIRPLDRKSALEFATKTYTKL